MFLVIFVLALVVILLAAALAIDLGNITQTKQHARNAADDAAVSAVVDLAPIAGGASAPAQETMAVTDVEDFVQSNYSSITAASWGATSCPGALPPRVTASSATDCIGFFNPSNAALNLSDPTGIAVAIPGQSVKYTFGKVGGLTSQGVSALAEASVQSPGAGFLLPFGFAAGGGGGLQCLKTGSGNKAATCTGFAIGSGQFGVLNSPRYLIYPGSDNSGGQNPVIMADIDLGIDHPLINSAYTSGASEVCDASGTPPNCPGYNNIAPYNSGNYAAPQTGQTLNDPAPAFFNADQNPFAVPGCTISTPRFAHPNGFEANGNCAHDNASAPEGPFLSSANSFGYGGTGLNGQHITDYLVGGTSNTLFTSCYAGTGLNPTSNALDNPAWTTGNGCLSTQIASLSANPACTAVPASTSCQIFSASIASSPRFGVVPVVAPSNGRNSAEITGFFDVYLDMAFGKNNKVDSLAAWVFPPSLVQTGSAGSGAGIGSFLGGPYVANLCSLVAGNC